MLTFSLIQSVVSDIPNLKPLKINILNLQILSARPPPMSMLKLVCPVPPIISNCVS